jgi:hypothetical protein
MNYEGLSEERVMQAAIALDSAPRPIRSTTTSAGCATARGSGPDRIPESHQTLVGENHEAGHRLGVRIGQGAAWLSAALAATRSPRASDFSDQSEQMESSPAPGGPARRGRPATGARRRPATSRAAVSVVQNHPRRDFYLKALRNPSVMTEGPASVTSTGAAGSTPELVVGRDNEGGLGPRMIRAKREAPGRLSRRPRSPRDRPPHLRRAESMNDD